MADAPRPFPLDDFLQQRWQPLAARVGERRAALLTSIDDKAAQRGFQPGLEHARFANLCMALGPGFETRPENEWALAILLDDRLDNAVRLHQLVVQGAAMLRRRGGPEAEALAQRLHDNDSVVLDHFDLPPRPPGARPRRHGPQPLRRVACDLEAAELRLLDTGFRQEYRRQADGSWQRVAVDAPAPLRIDAQHPAPERITVLARQDGQAEPLRLQARTVYHARCGLGLHPQVQWLGGSQREQWAEQSARAPAWAVSVPPEPDGVRLLQAAWHDISLLRINSCGLRDEGRPLGSAELQVWAYAARQSLVTLQREAGLVVALPDARSDPPAVKPTRLQVEHDGVADTGAQVDGWRQALDTGLREALAQGLQRLLQAWQQQVQEGALQAEFHLLDGRAALTWGWREGSRGLASPPVQRVVADLDLQASGQLLLTGLVDYAGAKARLRLQVDGQARLQTLIERLHADVELLAALQPAQLRWRWPVQLSFDPVAEAGGALFSELGPCSGALVGSLGLRPSPTQGGAWEWFVSLALEPVATRVVVHDPLLGRAESHMALLGSVNLLDWSLA